MFEDDKMDITLIMKIINENNET